MGDLINNKESHHIHFFYSIFIFVYDMFDHILLHYTHAIIRVFMSQFIDNFFQFENVALSSVRYGYIFC